MAKRKRTYRRAPVRRARAKTRTVYKRAPVRRRKKSGLSGEMGLMLGAGLYGAVRSKMSNFIAPYTTWIPGGAVADEVGMLLANYGVKKMVGNKVPMLKDVLKAGKTIEYARIGETIAMGGLNLGAIGGQSNSNQLSATVFV